LESDSATVIVNVPNTDMSSATRDLGLQVFSVSPAGMDAFARGGSIDANALLTKLKSAKAVSLKSDLPASKLGQAVQSSAGSRCSSFVCAAMVAPDSSNCSDAFFVVMSFFRVSFELTAHDELLYLLFR
jgi:hypothetical protein